MHQHTRAGKSSGWISVTDAGASVTLGRQKLSSVPRKSDLGLSSLQKRNGPCSREGKVGIESCHGLPLESGMGKTDIQSACLFWLPLIEVSASNVSIPLYWLKFKGSRWNSKEEHAGTFCGCTQRHINICIVFPKGRFTYTQKYKVEKLKKLGSNRKWDREIMPTG